MRYTLHMLMGKMNQYKHQRFEELLTEICDFSNPKINKKYSGDCEYLDYDLELDGDVISKIVKIENICSIYGGCAKYLLEKRA